jgi:hypothetical protein
MVAERPRPWKIVGANVSSVGSRVERGGAVVAASAAKAPGMGGTGGMSSWMYSTSRALALVFCRSK